MLDRNANPNGLWTHWDADVTPLHLAVLAGHPAIVKILIERGANPRIRDTKHDSDAFGWAGFFRHIDDNETRREVVAILKGAAAG